MKIKTIDQKMINWFSRVYLPMARLAVFVIYFYFGILKLLGESPATPAAKALVSKLGFSGHFDTLFILLAVFECVIGLLFLFPKFTRIVIPMLLAHMLIVCLPLILIPGLTFSKPFVPTLEGQYIIKNIAIIALAIGVAARTRPLQSKSR